MAGFFILELDTTAPDLIIYAPTYATNSSEMEIVVASDEVLSDGFQNFYIVDLHGKRHDLIFRHEGNVFVGNVTLSDFDNGLVTFYAQAKDEVGNLSPLSSKVIEVIPSVNFLRLTIEDMVIPLSQLKLSEAFRGIDLESNPMKNNLSIDTSTRELPSTISEREIGVGAISNNNMIGTEVVADG